MKTKEQIKKARIQVIEKYSDYLKVSEKLERKGKFDDNSLNEKMKAAKAKWETLEGKWHEMILQSVVTETKKKKGKKEEKSKASAEKINS